MKNIIAFLFGWLIAAVILIPQAHAAVVARPVVPGYSAGKFSSAAGTFAMTAANDGFITPATLNVGGRAITVSASLRMAANAGQYVKTGLSLTPLGLAGTLALPWLISEGWDLINGVWHATNALPSNIHGYDTCISNYGSGTESQMQAAILNDPMNHNYGCSEWHFDTLNGDFWGGWASPSHTGYVACAAYTCTGQPSPHTHPATPDDWAALPDPLPALAPELPYAPYLPEGVPVAPPEYQPQTVPFGDPYTKPDGSTVQPMAKISPASHGQVTIDTFDQPLTDAQGNPVPDPQPQDTPEPQPDPCKSHPDRVGCVVLGTAPAPELLQTLTVPVAPDYSPVGGAGSCPASVTVSGITWSYQPFCDFASAIRPLIIGFAWLSFAFIVAGTVRT